MDNLTSISFVVHKGKLETQALLLVASLRYYNQDKYKLYGCVPKTLGGIKNGITKNTAELLTQLGVNLVEINNPIGNDYLIGNKLKCLDSNNQKTKIFLDSDIICCTKFDFPNLKTRTIAIKPADRNTCAWDNSTWASAYKKFANYKLNEHDLVSSTAFNELMLPYFNAGVIIVKDVVEFSEAWSRLSKKLDSDDNYLNKRPWLDQLALPLTIKKLNLDYHCLTEDFNFPANIKPVSIPNKLVHYHRPEIICKNSYLINCISKISKKYTWINQVVNGDNDWTDVSILLGKYKEEKFYIPPKKTTKDIIITGIPRSGTSYLCSLLSKIDNHIVINEPKGILRPLKKRYHPWGVTGYYSAIRRDILLGKPILNKLNEGKLVEDTLINNCREYYNPIFTNNEFQLITKNTIGYITSIKRLLMVMPNAKYIGLFRHPIDTIASWKTSFPHLQEALPSKINILKQNSKWLDEKNKSIINEIELVKSITVRQSLLWNLLAKQLINFQHKLILINYDNLILDPVTILKSISTDKNISEKQFPSSTPRSKKNILTSEEISIISNLTNQLYLELMNISDKQSIIVQ